MFLRVISSFLFFFAENIREVNLIIEQGNTSSKVAVYKNGHIEASFVYKQFGVSVVAALFEKYAFTQGILSTVIDTDDELIAYLKNKLQRFVFLDEHVALPIKVEYILQSEELSVWPLSWGRIICGREKICWLSMPVPLSRMR